MDLNSAHIFVQVIEKNSFTGASAALGLPKQTVSRKIAELESDLGVQLIQRTTRQLRLTDHGKRFFEYALRIAELANKAEQDLSEASIVPRGTLKISAPTIFGELYLNQTLLKYMDLYPNVEVQIKYGASNNNPLQNGFDLCFSVGPIPESSNIAQLLFPSWRRLFAIPSLLDNYGPIEHPSQLKRIPCIFYGEEPILLWKFRDQHRPQQIMEISPEFRLISTSFWLAREATLKGMGVAMLPLSLCEYDLLQGNLIEILPEWTSSEHNFYALYPSNKQININVHSLLRMIHEDLNESNKLLEDEAPYFQGLKIDGPKVDWIQLTDKDPEE